jgi:hypothetical protein
MIRASCAFYLIVLALAWAPASAQGLKDSCEAIEETDPRVPENVAVFVRQLKSDTRVFQVRMCRDQSGKTSYALLLPPIGDIEGVCRREELLLPDNLGSGSNSTDRPLQRRTFMALSHACSSTELGDYVPVSGVTSGTFQILETFWGSMIHSDQSFQDTFSASVRKLDAGSQAEWSRLITAVRKEPASFHMESMQFVSASESGIGKPCYGLWVRGAKAPDGREKYMLLLDVVRGRVEVFGVSSLIP